MPLGKPPQYAKGDDDNRWKWINTLWKWTQQHESITTQTANYTVETNQYYVRGDATSGAITITLPTALNQQGRVITVMKIDSSGNAVSVARMGTDTINGSSSSVSLATQWSKAQFISNGVSNWERLI